MKDILFIGDSLTEFFDWQARFPGHAVRNFGVAGETVEGLLSRVGRVLASGERPDIVFIMSGINNIAMDDTDILGTFRKVLAEVASGSSGSTVVVQSVLPVLLPWVENADIAEMNRGLQALSAEYGARFLDVYSRFLDETGAVRTVCLSDDGVHLSPEGYRVWSAVVEDFITTT
jgi:lysophospholipase L1-like esterase